jgi:endonuclease/exonuclease/phosphatase family metal-dependent hydrolase
MKLKILFYNVENLFLSLENLSSTDFSKLSEENWQDSKASMTPNKSLKKTIGLRDIILKQDPDIILMCEVGGKESLENFNLYFLENKYECHTDRSNSKRGIDLGILVKKNFPSKCHLTNYLTYQGKNKHLKEFNRNVLKLNLESFKLNLFLVHLKSKLDKDKKDFWGLEARSQEVQGLIELLKSSDQDFILTGDFNGIASRYDTDEEFKDLYSLPIEDSFELMKLPIEERWTHHHFTRAYRRSAQLDYIFLSNNLHSKLLSATKIAYEDFHGKNIDPPKTLEEKLSYPSDHNPIMIEIEVNSHE